MNQLKAEILKEFDLLWDDEWDEKSPPTQFAEINLFISSALTRQAKDSEEFYATRCVLHEKQIREEFIQMLPPEKNTKTMLSSHTLAKITGWNDYRREFINKLKGDE